MTDEMLSTAPNRSVDSVRKPNAPKAAPAAQHIQHPKFRPTYLASDTRSPLSTDSEAWITPLSAPAYFPLDVFHSVLRQLSQHPEQNSGLIIRAESLPVEEGDDDDTAHTAAHLGLERIELVRLRFLPRQPRRDARMEQVVAAYSAPDGESERGVVVKIPQVKSAAEMPYYHPAVRKLAFIWEPLDEAEQEQGGANGEHVDDAEGTHRIYGRISISYLPFPDSPSLPAELLPPPPKPRKRSPLAGPVDNSADVRPPATVLEEDTEAARAEAKALAEKRLQRTCLALLEKIHKHGHGTLLGYVKRVNHDVVVKREPFQDLYQALKERHKHLDSRAPHEWSTKVEDLKRHVWKDIAIASFLMLLWRDMYPARRGPSITGMEWDAWGRPPAGFIDLGCGNGLVVHILISEGYEGKGYELRARRTWPQYPAATQAALVELPIDMPSWFPKTMEEWDSGDWPGRSDCVVKEGTFLLGNHADELTPWIPLLSLLPATPVPHLSLPCCLHTLDAKFTSLEYTPPDHANTPKGGFGDGLGDGASRYKAYVMWLGWCGLMCGWEWEKESLRIPSTRGWAIVARKRWTGAGGGAEDRACRQWALDEVNAVRARGDFKLRVKEGKDH